jgi:Base plate wedge protein 53
MATKKKYFNTFPVIQYNKNIALNICERTAIIDKVYNNPYLYQVIDGGARPDQIANKYYNDPYLDWLVFFSNRRLDPYYDWYLTETQFREYLKKKYNVYTTDILKERIMFFRNNWYNDDTSLSPSQYTALANNEKKYWKAIYANDYAPLSYVRDAADWTITTNKIFKYSTAQSANGFIDDEVVTIFYRDANNTSGNGRVVISNSTSLTLQHIQGYGNNVLNSNSYLIGITSGISANINSITLVANNLPDEELQYWDPVYIFDYENENNEEKKTIAILDTAYSSRATKDLITLMKE